MVVQVMIVVDVGHHRTPILATNISVTLLVTSNGSKFTGAITGGSSLKQKGDYLIGDF